MLTGIFFSAMLVGCNVDDQDTAPPEGDQNEEQNQEEEQNPALVEETPLEEIEEDIEKPFEDPDRDGVDENDPNPETKTNR